MAGDPYTVPHRKVEHDDRYGVPKSIWDKIQQVAASHGFIPLLRMSKPAAIPWIERNFPAKPKELEFLKVDPKKGLLLARTDAEKRKVYEAGYYVLQPAADAPLNPVIKSFQAVNKASHSSLAARFSEAEDSWVAADVVVNQQGKPITSDIDIAGFVFPDRPYSAGLLAVLPPEMGKSFNWRNPITDKAIDCVNAGLHELTYNGNSEHGVDRVMHSTNYQYKGEASPIGANDHGFLAFFSDQVMEFNTSDPAVARQAVDEICRAVTPPTQGPPAEVIPFPGTPGPAPTDGGGDGGGGVAAAPASSSSSAGEGGGPSGNA